MADEAAQTPETESAPAPRPAMRGDLTSGPILRTLILFSIPTLFGNILQSLSGTINSIWVGRLIGEDALAATANANIIMFLVAGAAFGFGMAATVKIGQRYGARDIEGARRTFGTAVGFSSVLMFAIAALGWVGAPALLTALETPGDAYGMALTYLRLMFVSMPFMMVSVILTMGLRGTGDARTPLIFMLVTVVIDAGLNPVLIAGYGPFPAMGIAGSATSTIIASLVSFVGMLIDVYAQDLPLRLRGPQLRYLWPRGEELHFIVTKGVPMGAQMFVMSAAGLIVVGLVNREGLLMTAAYAAAMQLFTYVQMPAMAIGGAVWAPLMIIAVALYPVRLGFYFLTYDWLGADAIWLSFTVGSIAGVALGWAFYHYSNWRKHAQAETAEEAQEQSQADGEPAGRMLPDV